MITESVVESPALEGFKIHVDMALGDIVVVLASMGEQLDLKIWEGFSNLRKSLILQL